MDGTGTLSERSSSQGGPAPLFRCLVVRTSGGPLRPLWSSAHALAARAVAAYLRAGNEAAASYAKRSFALGDVTPGRSDIDLAVVVDGPGESERAIEAVWRRWRRLARIPVLERAVDLSVHDRTALDDPCSSVLTYSLDRGSLHHAVAGGGRIEEAWWSRIRPGLYAPRWEWRRLTGAEHVPPSPAYDPQQRRIAAWLELTAYWSWTVGAAYDPRRCNPYTCAKFLAEAARIWLWVARGERVARRDDVLRRALVHLPEEERAFLRALELLGAPRATAERPLAELLPAFVRISARIAR